MAEGTTIRADQIEGLPDLIREQVREVLREEVKSAPEDMDQLRRSPAGTMIRLEEQVKALDVKTDQKFGVVDQRFESLRLEMDQRFEVVDQRFKALEEKMDQRFNAVDQRFDALKDALKSEMNQRFDAVERRFNLLQWAVGLIYPILLTLLGKLFLMK